MRSEMLLQVCEPDGKGRDSYRRFQFAGYCNPNESERSYIAGGYYVLGTPSDNVWYLNSAGYAQRYDPARPPSCCPCEPRVMLIPLFEEER